MKEEREYDKSFSIEKLSKWTDNIIVETADKYNVEYDVAAEILINVGGMYINEYNHEKE